MFVPGWPGTGLLCLMRWSRCCDELLSAGTAIIHARDGRSRKALAVASWTLIHIVGCLLAWTPRNSDQRDLAIRRFVSRLAPTTDPEAIAIAQAGAPGRA